MVKHSIKSWSKGKLPKDTVTHQPSSRLLAVYLTKYELCLQDANNWQWTHASTIVLDLCMQLLAIAFLAFLLWLACTSNRDKSFIVLSALLNHTITNKLLDKGWSNLTVMKLKTGNCYTEYRACPDIFTGLTILESSSTCFISHYFV